MTLREMELAELNHRLGFGGLDVQLREAMTDAQLRDAHNSGSCPLCNTKLSALQIQRLARRSDDNTDEADQSGDGMTTSEALKPGATWQVGADGSFSPIRIRESAETREEADDPAVDAFVRLGLSERAAKFAARGRQ